MKKLSCLVLGCILGWLVCDYVDSRVSPTIAREFAERSGWRVESVDPVPGVGLNGVMLKLVDDEWHAFVPTFFVWRKEGKQVRPGDRVSLVMQKTRCMMPAGCLRVKWKGVLLE